MSDFPEKAADEVNTLAVVTIGLATTAVLWASVMALQAYFMNSEGEIAAQQAQHGRAAIVRGLNAEQRADLSRTTYADPQKGTLKRLDIKFAKEVVVRDAQRGARTLIPTLGELNVPSINLDGKPLEATPPPAPVPAPVVPAPPAEGADLAVPPAPTAGATVPAPAPRPAAVAPSVVQPLPPRPVPPGRPKPAQPRPPIPGAQ